MGGSLDITLCQPQIKRGVKLGQVQISEILLTAYANEDALFDFNQVPGVVASMADARRLMTVRQPVIAQRLARKGIELLYPSPWPFIGISSTTPLPNIEALRGLRLRTYSAISNRLATLMGADCVFVPAPKVAPGVAPEVA